MASSLATASGRRSRLARLADARPAAGRRPRLAGRRVRPAQPLFAQLQSLELAFFDRQQTGQLMSRVTVDLQAVRFFLGYGLMFVMQSTLTIALAAIAMFLLQPELAAISLAAGPVRRLLNVSLQPLARPALEEVQQRIAELTAEVQENMPACASSRPSPGKRTSARASSARLTRLRAVDGRGATADPLQPADRLPATARPGGDPARRRRDVVHHTLKIGDFSAFYIYLLMLLSPMRTLGISLTMAQRATASGSRIFQMLDRAPLLRSLPARHRCRPAPATSASKACRCDTAERRPARHDIDLDDRRRAHGGAGRGDRLGQDDARRRSIRDSTTRARGAC